jgi:hypothetical protein
MKNLICTSVIILSLVLAPIHATSQVATGGTFRLEQQVIAGGGGQGSTGTSGGTTYTLDGTIGQSVAGGPATGGTYSLTSGFWSFTQAAPLPAIEGDVAPRPNGDLEIQANDVVQVRRFLNEIDAPSTLSSEFQRADSAPRASLGNGAIESSDVIQTIRYLNEIDPVQNAGGPAAPLGPLTGEQQSLAPTRDSIKAHTNATDIRPGAVGAPEIRVESRNGTAGQMVTVNIRVDSLGTESQYAFSLNFDTTRLTYSSNSAGTTGALSSSCNLTATPGRVRCQIGSFPNNNPASSEPSIGEIPAGSNQLLIGVTFLIANGAATGPTNLTFSGVSASDDAANSITLMTTNGTLTILAPTAASVSVSGQLVTAAGNGVTNATVVLTDSLGNRRSALSSSFGHFSFEGVAAGQTYTISVDSKRFRFSPQVVTVVDDVNGLVFVAEP